MLQYVYKQPEAKMIDDWDDLLIQFEDQYGEKMSEKISDLIDEGELETVEYLAKVLLK